MIDMVHTGPRVSPSAGRAWIEIPVGSYVVYVRYRRPPRGGRGLKFQMIDMVNTGPLVSPSAGRAWIEIVQTNQPEQEELVALRGEGVD